MAPSEISPAATTTSNGHINGHTNGHSNGINGHTNDTNGHTNGHRHENEEDEDDDDIFPDNLSLRIMGIGVSYPPHRVTPQDLETIAKKFHPQTDAMKKVLSINRFTGIISRPAIGDLSHPLANQPSPPSITALHDIFMEIGVPLAVSSCQKALSDANYSPKDITHTVFTTCTDSSNPGYDVSVLKSLHLKDSVEKVLLSGVGCSGGLAGLRTACNIALGARVLNRKARVLVCATELCTSLVRSELESIEREGCVRIGVTLFSDCSSTVVVSNGVGEDWSSSVSSSSSSSSIDRLRKGKRGVYEVLGWKHKILPDSEKELGFDVDPLGWKVILTPLVPSLTSSCTPSLYSSLLSSIPSSTLSSLSPKKLKTPSKIEAKDFDWALHPGGSLILSSIAQTMGINESNLRASYEIYTNYGNSSSATVFSVMDRLRSETEAGVKGEGEVYGKGVGVKGGRKGVVGCAFGPGVSVEMMLMRRVDDEEEEEGLEEIRNGVQGVEVGGEELD